LLSRAASGGAGKTEPIATSGGALCGSRPVQGRRRAETPPTGAMGIGSVLREGE